MADNSIDEKKEQMKVFKDILKSQYKLIKDHCDKVIKIIGESK